MTERNMTMDEGMTRWKRMLRTGAVAVPLSVGLVLTATPNASAWGGGVAGLMGKIGGGQIGVTGVVGSEASAAYKGYKSGKKLAGMHAPQNCQPDAMADSYESIMAGCDRYGVADKIDFTGDALMKNAPNLTTPTGTYGSLGGGV